MSVPVALIAAVAANGVIGAGGTMPWRLSTDMQRFRRLTMGKPVIMGRRTFDSLGKPLAGRTNIVVTRRPEAIGAGATGVASLEDALAAAALVAEDTGAVEIMVIGGGEIYAAALPFADTLYLTHVAAAPEGDTRFPSFDLMAWSVVSRETVPAGPRDSAATEFVVYARRR